MKTNHLRLISGATQAKGLTVIIDVFRAFSTSCYLFANGAERIFPIGTLESAYEMKRKNPDFILIGERETIKPEGFDFGNSPTHILEKDFTGKSVILTTSAGTQGIVNAKGASEIITGSFVNLSATVSHIAHKNPEEISVVAMGNSGIRIAEEDELCASSIIGLLTDPDYIISNVREVLRNNGGERFFDPQNERHSPPSDFELCTAVDKFSFAIRYDSDLKQLLKVDN